MKISFKMYFNENIDFVLYMIMLFKTKFDQTWQGLSFSENYRPRLSNKDSILGLFWAIWSVESSIGRWLFMGSCLRSEPTVIQAATAVA